MSRMTTSRASLSWTSAAMRRACSIGLKRLGVYPPSAGVEPLVPDDRERLLRDVAVHLGAGLEQRAEVARRDGHRIELEERDPFRMVESTENRVELCARESRSRGDTEADETKH